MIRVLLGAVVLAIPCAFRPSASTAAIAFQDDFNAGASASWTNGLGDWAASGGVYYAQQPHASGASPQDITHTELPLSLTDFAVEVDINNVDDGGIWLRSAGNQNGVLLVTGGDGGTASGHGGDKLYWHIIQNGSFVGGTYNLVGGVFTPGVSDVRIRVEVIGDTYSAYVNGGASPVTTLTTSLFASGTVGLFSASGQTFDNVVVTVPDAVPEATSVACWAGLGLAFVGLNVARRYRKR